MDPEPACSTDKISGDSSQPSYCETVGNIKSISTIQKRHLTDTRLRTRMRSGDSRLYCQQFDYSDSNPECAHFDDLLPNAPHYSDTEPPALREASMPQDAPPLSAEFAKDVELPLFFEHDFIPEVSQTQDNPTVTPEVEVSLAVTSAPLLTNRSFTDVSNIIPKLLNSKRPRR